MRAGAEGEDEVLGMRRTRGRAVWRTLRLCSAASAIHSPDRAYYPATLAGMLRRRRVLRVYGSVPHLEARPDDAVVELNAVDVVVRHGVADDVEQKILRRRDEAD